MKQEVCYLQAVVFVYDDPEVDDVWVNFRNERQEVATVTPPSGRLDLMLPYLFRNKLNTFIEFLLPAMFVIKKNPSW